MVYPKDIVSHMFLLNKYDLVHMYDIYNLEDYQYLLCYNLERIQKYLLKHNLLMNIALNIYAHLRYYLYKNIYLGNLIYILYHRLILNFFLLDKKNMYLYYSLLLLRIGHLIYIFYYQNIH